MNDSYKILEIDPSVTDDQVKNAYLNMQRKYHPDNYEDGPLKDLAVEKTEQITKAFDEIMNERRAKQAQESAQAVIQTSAMQEENSDQSNQSQNQSENQNTQAFSGFDDIRNMIAENRLIDAEKILDSIELDGRTAQWYFLKGKIFFARGWVDDASNFFSTAVRMDPNNGEYREALAQMNWQKQGGYGNGTGQNNQGPYRQPAAPNTGCSMCDVCAGIMCADCCCECMGGRCC